MIEPRTFTELLTILSDRIKSERKAGFVSTDHALLQAVQHLTDVMLLKALAEETNREWVRNKEFER